MPISLSSMEDNNTRIPPCKIIRRSIYTLLQNYHYFTTTTALLAFPFSATILLSHTFIPSSSSSLLQLIYSRLEAFFEAAGFPRSSGFFTLINLKLSQTISANIFTLPFTLTFLLVAKASVIQALNHHKPCLQPSFSSVISIFSHLFVTYVWNSFLIISANATAFCLLFFIFSFLEGLGYYTPTCLLFLSASGAVLYSIILANTLIICNLSLVLSGFEKSGGHMAILKACIMIRDRASTALTIALPVNMGMAGIEALFQYRIGEKSGILMGLEATLIAYMYSILIVLDTIMNCQFYRSCKASSCVDQEWKYAYRIEISEEDNRGYLSLKVSEEFP
ncbi:hypothetical protein K2173_019741 [Erythroxylum novogranatense]|uniref:Uncharacterized protein n=1 Tax=Erythroxylum novogranatense TaxID=1862640 RepID=A0AAV8SM84_9ROSI|nr:hypothetical protein K2173_019741 [Erythroxylum novogranatense]